MMPRMRLAATLVLPLLSGGCLVKTALDVATLPVKAAGKAVDWSTTSQSEADRNAGRKLRRQHERAGRERREADQDCRKSGSEDCARHRDER